MHGVSCPKVRLVLPLTAFRCNVLVMATVAVLTLYFRKKNKQADRGEVVLLEDPNFRFTI